MKKNIIPVVLLSVIFVHSLLYEFNLAFAILAAIIYVVISLKSEQAVIKFYFFIYLFFSGVADKFFIPIYGGRGINFIGILNILLILTFCLKFENFIRLKNGYWNKSLIYSMFFFVCCVIFTTPFSHDIEISIRELIRVSSAISFYYLAYYVTVHSKNSQENIFRFITFIFFVLSIFGILEYAFSFNIFKQGSAEEIVVLKAGRVVAGSFNRISTTFVHPGYYACAIVVFLPLNIYYLIKNTKKIYWLGFILVFINLIFTFIRISWIVAAIQVIFAFFLFRSKKLYIIGLLLFPICIVMAAKIIERLVIDTSVLGRYELSQYGFNLFKSNPVFGIGPGTFLKITESQFGREMNAHNDYMKMFAETGIFGGLSYLILLFTHLVFAVKNLKKNDLAKVTFLTLIGFMIFSVTSNAFSGSYFFWGLLGIYTGLIVRNNSRVIYNVSETRNKYYRNARVIHVPVEMS